MCFFSVRLVLECYPGIPKIPGKKKREIYLKRSENLERFGVLLLEDVMFVSKKNTTKTDFGIVEGDCLVESTTTTSNHFWIFW